MYKLCIHIEMYTRPTYLPHNKSSRNILFFFSRMTHPTMFAFFSVQVSLTFFSLFKVKEHRTDRSVLETKVLSKWNFCVVGF